MTCIMQVTRRATPATMKKPIKPTPHEFPRSRCAIANTLDLVGDKWSLLVVRDMLHGKATYKDLLDTPEGIPTNILAERLKRLEAAGIIERAPYQERPVRYSYALTRKGLALGEVLLALVHWGKRYVPGSQTLARPLADAAQAIPVRRSAPASPGKRHAR